MTTESTIAPLLDRIHASLLRHELRKHHKLPTMGDWEAGLLAEAKERIEYLEAIKRYRGIGESPATP